MGDPPGGDGDDGLTAGAQVPIDPAAAEELLHAARDLQAEAGRARPLPGGVVVRADEHGERFEPVGASGGRPVLYVHGGGYALGSVRSHASLAARVAAAARRPVLLARYRQGPEHPYPAGLDDVHACLRALGGTPLLAGDSAGGGLALALALRLRDAGEPLPPAIALIAPWVDLSLEACWRDPAARPPARDDDLDPEQLAITAQAYAGTAALDDPCVSPARAETPAGLPPLLVQLAEGELLAPDADRLARRARAAGVDVTVQVTPGVGHVWHMDETPEADAAIGALGRWLAAQPPGTATPDS